MTVGIEGRADDEGFDDIDEYLADNRLTAAPRLSLTTGCGQKSKVQKKRRQMRAWIT